MWATFGIQFKYLPHSGYHKPSGDFRRHVFRLSPALLQFSPKSPCSPKSPVFKGPGRFLIIASPLSIFPKIAIFAQIASLQGARTFFDYRQPSGDFPQNGYFRLNRQSPRGRDVFRLSPAIWWFSPKWLFSPKSPVSKGPGRFSIIASHLAIFPKMAIFAQIASLQGAGTFFDYRQLSGDFPQNGYFRPNRQSQRGRDVFRH